MLSGVEQLGSFAVAVAGSTESMLHPMTLADVEALTRTMPDEQLANMHRDIMYMQPGDRTPGQRSVLECFAVLWHARAHGRAHSPASSGSSGKCSRKGLGKGVGKGPQPPFFHNLEAEAMGMRRQLTDLTAREQLHKARITKLSVQNDLKTERNAELTRQLEFVVSLNARIGQQLLMPI
jgi:hypothetical protein